MKKRDLTPEKIIQVYIELAEKLELDQVTFPRIAEKLAIKPPSLYNHFKNLTDLKIQTAIYLQQQLLLEITDRLVGKAGVPAIYAYAHAYRDFAERYQAVYELMNAIPQFKNAELSALGHKNAEIITKIFAVFDLSKEEILLKSRALRSVLHGYISLSQLGYFQNQRLSALESFDGVLAEFTHNLPVN